MASALYILHWPDSDLRTSGSEVLLHRDYHNDLPERDFVLNNFDQAYKSLRPEERSPFIFHNGINYVYMHGENNLILLAVAKCNINAMSIVVFLNKLYGILHHYLSTLKKQSGSDDTTDNSSIITIALDKDIIIDNFNLIFELMDECMDFGIVQLTDYNILKEYIKLEVNHPKFRRADGYESSDSSFSDDDTGKVDKKLSKSKNNKIKSTHNQANRSDVLSQDSSHINSSIVRTSSLAINWRPKGIFYAKNEIYIDIIENCEFFFDLESNTIRRNEIYGICAVKCYLSGMPICKIGFNEQNISGIENDDNNTLNESVTRRHDNMIKSEDSNDEDNEDELLPTKKRKQKIPIRNIQFHQCIQLGSIYQDNIINFTPPDDKFTLMTYHVENQKQRRKLPLIMVQPTFRIIYSTNKLQILCILTTNFKKRLHALNIMVRIPIHPQLFSILHSVKSEENLKFKAEAGIVSYKIDSSELCWNIDNLNGRSSVKMMAELSLETSLPTKDRVIDILYNKFVNSNYSDEGVDDIDNSKAELDQFYGVNGAISTSASRIRKRLVEDPFRSDIRLTFDIPMLSYSGLKLNYLRVDEEQMKYTCFPWVRYCTQSHNKPSSSSNSADMSRSADSNCIYRFKPGITNFQFIN